MMSFLLALLVFSALSKTISILDHGAVAGPVDTATGLKNTAAISAALQSAQPGDEVLLPTGEPFYAYGGITASGLDGVTITFAGELRAIDDYEHWPLGGHGDPKGDSEQETRLQFKEKYQHLIYITNSTRLTIGGGGKIDGQGVMWWNKEILGQLPAQRPKLVYLYQCTHVLMENLLLHNSPSFHVRMDDCAHVEVRHVTIKVDRKKQQEIKAQMRELRLQAMGLNASALIDGPDWPYLQPEDLNTDGFDPSGIDFWIHDCEVQNDDDSIAVKPCDARCQSSPCSQDMLFERISLTGFGASIGSVPPHEDVNCVRNITFRDITMPHTGKGVYVKSNPSCTPTTSGIIEDIVFEDMTIDKPTWWPIWIGPQQQHEPNTDLGDKCALAYPLVDHCPTQGCVTIRNILLKNISITNPLLSPGVILGNVSNPMSGLTFDGVVVSNPGQYPFKGNYQCQHVKDFVSTGGTTPVPPCATVH